jgi:hypothetical protein
MRIIACALASGVALGLTGGAASAQQQFDGNWSVEVTTQQGGCAKRGDSRWQFRMGRFTTAASRVLSRRVVSSEGASDAG